jgi:hypothetical protein
MQGIELQMQYRKDDQRDRMDTKVLNPQIHPDFFQLAHSMPLWQLCPEQ